MNKIPEISVFFPAYNEEENIESTVSKAVTVCTQIAERYEIIVVNDGSRDRTPEIVEKMILQNSNIRLISHDPNRGYGAALKTGMHSAQYNVIAFTDGDGQFDFSEITNFLPYLQSFDLIIGFRKKRIEGLKRILIAGILKVAAFILFGLRFKDIDCAFKVFNKSVVEKVWPLQAEGALISTEFLYKAKHAGCKITEVPVHHYPRGGGKPTGSSPKVLFKAGIEILRLWIKLK
jgi:glycosyltransferase involved in cell wall biosynthesis